MTEQLPSPQDIALAALAVPDYSPLAELAKAAVMISQNSWPYDMRNVAGLQLTAWQAKIAEVHFMAILSMTAHG